MTKPPTKARFLKSSMSIAIQGGSEFSLIPSSDEQLHASLPDLAEVSMVSLTTAVEELSEAIDDPYLKIYFYDQGPTFNPEVSPRAPFTLEMRGSGRMWVAAQLDFEDLSYEPYPELFLLTAPLLKRHGAVATRTNTHNEWGKVRIFLEFEYASLRGVRVGDAHRLAREVSALASAVAKKGQFDASVVDALIQSRQSAVLIGQKEHDSFDAKGAAYELAVPEERYELAKDVAAFSNSDAEGLIVCGLRTRKVQGVDTVSQVAPVPLERVRPRDWIKAVRRLIVPSPEGVRVTIKRLDGSPNAGFVLISIPRQPDHLRPFLLVVGRRDDGKVVETDITVPIRVAADTEYADAASIHSLLAVGRAALGTGA